MSVLHNDYSVPNHTIIITLVNTKITQLGQYLYSTCYSNFTGVVRILFLTPTVPTSKNWILSILKLNQHSPDTKNHPRVKPSHPCIMQHIEGVQKSIIFSNC